MTPSLSSIFGAIIVLSPDKRDVLIVPQENRLDGFGRLSYRFPGTTLELKQGDNPLLPHWSALAMRVLSTEGAAIERTARLCNFLEGTVDASTLNWGTDIATLFRDDIELHGKDFRCLVMKEDFNWSLVRKETIQKPSDFWTNLLPPRMIPLEEMTNTHTSKSSITIPIAHRTIANKLLNILKERVYFD